jgi:hypothetical protein
VHELLVVAGSRCRARLTVARGRSESLTMKKRRQDSTLRLLAIRLANVTLTRKRWLRN